MTATSFILRVPAILAAGLFALTALAQQEQWLEYHTAPSRRATAGSNSPPTPPPNVALPKLQPGAYFGRWTNALDASRRTLVLPRSLAQERTRATACSSTATAMAGSMTKRP